MGAAAANGDADLLGEVLDCLKCLGQADGATAAAYRKLFEFAASSLGRGAATATDAAQKAASSEAAATDGRTVA